MEEHPQYLSLIQPLFIEIAAARLKAITSMLTLMETLVLPYRMGNILLAKKYQAILTKSQGLRMDEITINICQLAAQLRAAYGVKTSDALQLAVALNAQCAVFLTNDRALPAIPGIRIIQIKNYL